ncbi:hypothetical protein SNEBB_002590 [Seison nebaliae]|nr:hypothetical protein SNEBB_002590 [Seison nebaliae]
MLSTKLTIEEMKDYLSKKNEYKAKNNNIDNFDFTVIIRHAKVAQKSYGNEKRFFCPPPLIYLRGESWTNYFRQRSNIPPNAFISIGCDTQTDRHPLIISSDSTKEKFFAAKTLFISDSDKRKQFKLHLRLFDENLGRDLGEFQSNCMKVISKPSKKKQSIKNADLCIASGSRITLFNRLRSQTVSTRYMYVDSESENFIAHSQQWGEFLIHLVDANEKESNVYTVREGYVHYESTIKLKCVETNIVLPKMIIRKVDKSCINMTADEPLSQLHKCAFALADGDDQSYIGLQQEKIQICKGQVKTNNTVTLNDNACWTIISTDRVEYSWYTPRELTNDMRITPVPIVHSISISELNGNALVQLKGESFTPVLQIWFDYIPSTTYYRCSQLLKCYVPPIQNFFNELPRLTNMNDMNKTVDIFLVRNDGVIYPTGLKFSYTPKFLHSHTLNNDEENQHNNEDVDQENQVEFDMSLMNEQPSDIDWNLEINNNHKDSNDILKIDEIQQNEDGNFLDNKAMNEMNNLLDYNSILSMETPNFQMNSLQNSHTSDLGSFNEQMNSFQNIMDSNESNLLGNNWSTTLDVQQQEELTDYNNFYSLNNSNSLNNFFPSLYDENKHL